MKCQWFAAAWAGVILASGLVGGCAGSGGGDSAAAGGQAESSGVVAAPVPNPAEMEAAAAARSGAVGKPAPDFSLLTQDDRPLSLAGERGKWVVLYFYPADDTPGCTCQATEFTALLRDFTQRNAKVYGVSPDTPDLHRHFMKKYGLQINLLSDPDRGVMRQYGAWVDIPEGPAAPGRVVRSTYLIDPNGVVAAHWPEVIPQGHAERVMRRLGELSTAPTGGGGGGG